jgi:hypothetical protein
MPAIEFNMAYFDTFSDITYRMKVLNLFPDEFKKGYVAYKQGRLKTEVEKVSSWYLLTPGLAFKFNLNNNDVPMFLNVIPALLDLDDAQGLDRKKQM